MEKNKSKKLRSKWKKGNDRAPTAEERQYIERARESTGWRHGAKVYKRP